MANYVSKKFSPTA